MPSDPAWLPSAIMQTLGALYGVFFFGYIYGTVKLREDLVKLKSETKLDASKKLEEEIRTAWIVFGFVTIAVAATILNSASELVDLIATGSSNRSPYSTLLFYGALVFIMVFGVLFGKYSSFGYLFSPRKP